MKLVTAEVMNEWPSCAPAGYGQRRHFPLLVLLILRQILGQFLLGRPLGHPPPEEKHWNQNEEDTGRGRDH